MGRGHQITAETVQVERAEREGPAELIVIVLLAAAVLTLGAPLITAANTPPAKSTPAAAVH